MDAIEKLARDICWAEFPSRPKGETKASYWRKIHPDAKTGYIVDAKWLVFIVGKLAGNPNLGACLARPPSLTHPLREGGA